MSIGNFMRISGLCLLISALVMLLAGYARMAGLWGPRAVSMLVLLATAIACLGALEVKIHRQTRCRRQRHAHTLAAALRNGALR